MSRSSTWVTFLLLTPIFACSTTPEPSADNLRGEVETFMVEYAEDVSSRDAEAVASRYNRHGAYMMGNGRKRFTSFDSIRVRYQRQWANQVQRPFEFKDLSMEILGSDAVLVSAIFDWNQGDSLEALKMSYTGVLTRQDGALRILLEDESFR